MMDITTLALRVLDVLHNRSSLGHPPILIGIIFTTTELID